MNICPYCGNTGDSYFTIRSWSYSRCAACDLIYLDERKSYDDVVANYRQSGFNRYILEQVEGRREKLFNHILDLVEEHIETGRLLDVGTSCGFFLVAAREKGWEVMGVEPSMHSVELAQKQNSLDVFQGTLQEYNDNGQFDVITFINVLEHSTLPWREIDRASKLLRPGGLLYLRFPNGFLQSRVHRAAHNFGLSRQLGRFLVFHQYSFTPEYVRRLLHNHGFVRATVFHSPPSNAESHKPITSLTLSAYLKRFIYSIAKCAENMSRRRLFLGTSLEVIAIKPDYPGTG
jgi:2-polyprenyl-3-methyl-5-hydroxy-6-metoxy-1,4-benzoquinol methylase